jgi:hypothetical protein
VLSPELREELKLHKQELLSLASRRREEVGDPDLVPVPRDGRPLELSYGQQRLWFLDQLHEDFSGYNLDLPIRLRGRLDRAALERSLDELVRRHEILRTALREVCRARRSLRRRRKSSR